MNKKIFEKSAGTFLNLRSCASSIRWGVSSHVTARYSQKGKKTTKPYYGFDFEISMTDCSRSIKWDGDASPRLAKKKLRIAIRTFQQALAAVCLTEQKIRAAKRAAK